LRAELTRRAPALVQATCFALVEKDGAMSRVEAISDLEQRLQWSKEQKRAIVAETFAPGASVSAVARRTDVGPGQIYRWRRDFRSQRSAGTPHTACYA
jgi:transposase